MKEQKMYLYLVFFATFVLASSHMRVPSFSDLKVPNVLDENLANIGDKLPKLDSKIPNIFGKDIGSIADGLPKLDTNLPKVMDEKIKNVTQALPTLDIKPPSFLGKDIFTKDDRSNKLVASELFKKEGYTVEEHVVETEDGYILTMHRIPGPPGAPTVYIQHGLLSSSVDWIVPGKNKALPFILADLGYDVWLGNTRGNTYSKSHKTIPPNDVRYWDFSWHEMGIYDLPALISYVVKQKGGNITYIGHSMGTTMFYVMAIERPDIASNISLMISLAPVAFMENIKSPLRLLAPFTDQVEAIFNLLGKGEFLPQRKVTQHVAKLYCGIVPLGDKVCENSLFLIAGFDRSQFNSTLMPTILTYSPAGASTKSMIHYAQEINSGRFHRFDYGPDENMKKYNSSTPPDYDLSKIKVPMALFWGVNDFLAHPTDVNRLFDGLPNKVMSYQVKHPKFSHIDFLWAVDAPSLLYKEIVDLIKKYSKPTTSSESNIVH
ncbi:lipase 3-like [Copidosoma floridanum]|uniref:lipase 3-like n=1 Tax=Copidosoma floridanum TaxID=29053 RepID=UPI0006C9A4C3|nr:lipase 3-like [Copidosoma floridanum]